VPLLVAFVWLLFRKMPASRGSLSKNALIISSSYLALTVMVKLAMLARVNHLTEEHGWHPRQALVAPAMFTPLLWSVVIDEGDHFLVGYVGVFDKEAPFRSIPANHQLLQQLGESDEVKLLTKFSKGYFVLEQDGDNFIWNDLRFGTNKGWLNENGQFIFSFRLMNEGKGITVERRAPAGVSIGDFGVLFSRALGN